MSVIRAGVVAVVAIMAIWPARAAKWDIKPTASIGEEFTDNLGLRTDSQDRNSDLVTTATPGISVRGTGGRISLNGDYSYSRLFHMHATNQDAGINALTTSGVAEIWEQSIFLDGSAQISQQVANTQGAISQSAANSRVNTLETTSWTLGPRFLHHFGTWAETTSIISRSAVSTNGNNNNTGTTPTTVSGSSPLTKSTTDRSSFVMKSGRHFTQVLWTATASATKISNEQTPHHSDKLGRVDLTYVVNRQISLTSGAGLQVISDDSLLKSPHGPIWSIGTIYRPGPRTTLQVAYNKQFDQKFFTYSGSYNISPRTSFSFNHSETITTTSQLIAQNLAFIGVLPDGTLIDLRTGQPFNPAANPPGLETDTLRQATWAANFLSRIGRNSYSAGLTRTESTVERTGQVTTTSGIVATYGRSLTHRLTGTMSANYQVSSSTGGPVTTTAVPAGAQTTTTNILLSGSLAYSLAKDTSLNFTLHSSTFKAADPTQSTHEKSASVVVTRTF